MFLGLYWGDLPGSGGAVTVEEILFLLSDDPEDNTVSFELEDPQIEFHPVSTHLTFILEE